MLNNFLKLSLILIGIFIGKAQENQVIYKTQNYRAYSQFSLYMGYNIPLSDPDFGTLKYKGDIATGLSYHNFWDWWGIQADIGYTFTNIDSKFKERVNYTRVFSSGDSFESNFQYYDSYKDKLKQLFLGIGPAFKYQSQNDKFVIDLGLLAGIGIPQKGSYLQYGVDQSFNDLYGLAVAYHAGFDRNAKFAIKPNLRFNYFFRPDFGIFIGSQYTHFFKAEEASDNDLLVEYNFQNIEDTYYYFEPIVEQGEPSSAGLSGYLTGIDVQRSGNQDNIGNFDLSAVQIVGGVTWKVNKTTTSKKCPNGYYLCPEDQMCYENNDCGIAPQKDVKVTVKDQKSNQALVHVKVELLAESQTVVPSDTTNEEGSVTFESIENDNYIVQGSLAGFNITDAAISKDSISSDEFNQSDIIEKTLYYSGDDFILSGKAEDCHSNEVLANTKIKIVNTQTAASYELNTDSQGNFTQLLPQGEYIAEIQKEAYFSERKEVSLKNRTTSASQFLILCAQKLECNQQLQFKNLLFELDDYHLTPHSTSELDNLAAYLTTNTEVQLELYSYTDSRGSKTYNKNLSQKRAEESVKYLVKKGVNPKQLKAQGFGEENLLNQCSDGVKCTEEEHAINRRTEFKVVCPE